MPILRGNLLLKYVDGTENCPPVKLPQEGTSQQLDNPNYLPWFCQDQALLGLLISSLREDLIPLIINAKTSRELWVMLETTHASPSVIRILNLQLSLQETKQNDRTISEFLYRAKSIADQLAATSRPVCPTDFNVVIFKGLRPKFHSIIPSLANNPTPVTF